MNTDERNRMMEDLIDEALAAYSMAEPRVGLEQRILANLTEQHPVSRLPLFARILLPAVLAVAVATAVFIVHGPTRPARRSIAEKASPVYPLTPSAQRPSSGAPNSTVIRHPSSIHGFGRNGRREPLPRLAQFPSPEPLSEQEQLLLRFVSQHRVEAVEIAKAQKQPLEDLKIEDLTIAPLTPDSKTNPQDNP